MCDKGIFLIPPPHWFVGEVRWGIILDVRIHYVYISLKNLFSGVGTLTTIHRLEI